MVCHPRMVFLGGMVGHVTWLHRPTSGGMIALTRTIDTSRPLFVTSGPESQKRFFESARCWNKVDRSKHEFKISGLHIKIRALYHNNLYNIPQEQASYSYFTGAQRKSTRLVQTHKRTYTIPPCVPENPACRHADTTSHHNKVDHGCAALRISG
ncbi:hypothetical protein CC86DRAFT_389144 [Ophiobolus disseminans]|uniref:Uncharacterized protein n=1 Tax=Ophiobolus disseminans TaxID=1469910 RepID=A0A6A6ZBR4_9PLEO|nr:hypothetical protein CC86DRAFT_389144 [Ophiobolus disseminans]